MVIQCGNILVGIDATKMDFATHSLRFYRGPIYTPWKTCLSEYPVPSNSVELVSGLVASLRLFSRPVDSNSIEVHIQFNLISSNSIEVNVQPDNSDVICSVLATIKLTCPTHPLNWKGDRLEGSEFML